MPLPDEVPQLPGPQIAAILKEEAADLEAYLADLPAQAWERPSGASGWTVAEVVAHVAMGADSYHTYVSRALRGDVSPPPGLPEPTKAYLDPSLSPGIAQRTREFRQTLGSDVLSSLRASSARLHQLLDSLGPGDWSRPAYHRLGLVTVRVMTVYRVSEVCLHTWDLKAGLETSPSLHPRSFPPLVERVPGWLETGFHPQAALAEPLRYRFHLSEPLPARWDLVLHGDRPEVAPATSGCSDVVFRCGPETAILVFTGRIPWQKARDGGQLTVEGKPEHVALFFDAFRPF